MTRVTWMLTLALQLPATDPIRQQAVDELSTRLAERHQQMRKTDEYGEPLSAE